MQDWGQRHLPVSKMNNELQTTNNQLRLSRAKPRGTMNCEQSTTNNELRTMNSFLQNKPNLLNARMNINKVLKRNYENQCSRTRTENKPKQTQFRRDYLKTQPIFSLNFARSIFFTRKSQPFSVQSPSLQMQFVCLERTGSWIHIHALTVPQTHLPGTRALPPPCICVCFEA